MIIALDYDNTYTADQQLWNNFILDAQHRGHVVICVTMRRPDEPVTVSWKHSMPVYYTSRKAKKKFIEDLGITPAIWIDDSPLWILADAWVPEIPTD